MSQVQQNSQANNAGAKKLIYQSVLGIVGGGLLALGVYRVTILEKVWVFVVVGAALGWAVGLIWQPLRSLWKKFQSEEWRVTDIEIGADGPKWKLANGSSQRRVAWSLFVELATRVVTQPMSGTEGDDCAALKSLHALFQTVRKTISEMEPTSLPADGPTLDTVETYALAMLNQDLRPFLSRWHPVYDNWAQSHKEAHCSDWDRHSEFREDLETLRHKIIGRARGLGKIAKVPDVDRFLNIAAAQANS